MWMRDGPEYRGYGATGLLYGQAAVCCLLYGCCFLKIQRGGGNVGELAGQACPGPPIGSYGWTLWIFNFLAPYSRCHTAACPAPASSWASQAIQLTAPRCWELFFVKQVLTDILTDLSLPWKTDLKNVGPELGQRWGQSQARSPQPDVKLNIS